MSQTATPHTKRAIERELDACEGIHHYRDDYWLGVCDALMWILGRTPPPSNELPDEPTQ